MTMGLFTTLVWQQKAFSRRQVEAILRAGRHVTGYTNTADTVELTNINLPLSAIKSGI